MKIKCAFKIFVFLITINSFSSWGKNDVESQLLVSPTAISFTLEGGTSEIIVTSNTRWNINNSASWLQLSQVAGNSNTVIQVNATTNYTNTTRTAELIINIPRGQTRRILVSQVPAIYPSYNTSPIAPDATGMSSNAIQLAANIKLGWNLGNTLEAMNNNTTGNETAWGNPVTTKALIDLVKASGFNAVRLPCSWNGYLADSATAKIKPSWLNHIKEVVQYCVDNDMYVLLNIHWDGGWLDENINPGKQDKTKAKQKAFWEQIATHLRDFDEHLMFASANEPPVDDATKMEILNSYHQAFVDAVRSTGGRNSYRVLVVQGPGTDIDKTEKLMNKLPSDLTPNRMMVEVHYYGPSQFCLLREDATWGKMFYYWGNRYHSTTDASRNATWGEEDYVVAEFQKMKAKFVDKGVPVLLGEFGALRHTALMGDNLTLHLASRAYWDKYITQQARAHGMLPFYWDEGSIGNDGFGILDRKNLKVFDQQVLNALIEGAK
ncbi:MAG TPA: cellulase family glycosylhydrolase [Cyclobacteriaceae bacterium]